MTNDEIAGRLLVLEAIATVSLSATLVKPGRPVTATAANSVLNPVREMVEALASEHPPAIAREAREYADHYLSHFLENLDALNGGNSPSRP